MTSILKADTIQDTDGNNIINENSNTITIGASGDTTNIIGTLQNNGSAVGGVNTPAFEAKINGTGQDITSDTNTKIAFATENFDTDSKYDTSNYRFTPTVAGKYFVYMVVSHRQNQNKARYAIPMIYKNGSPYQGGFHYGNDDYKMNWILTTLNTIITLDADDYIEAFTRFKVTSGNCTVDGNDNTSGSDIPMSYWGAYKIIE